MTMAPDTHHPARAFDDPAITAAPRGLPIAPEPPAMVCRGSLALGACLGLFVGLAIATVAMLRIC
jgi:hypothetical protein